MSQSLSVKDSHSQQSFSSIDVLFALLAHLLIAGIIVVLAMWESDHKPEPLKRIEVTMISAQALKKLQHPKQHKKHAIKHKKNSKPKPKKISKPIKKKPVIKKNPVLKKTPPQVKLKQPKAVKKKPIKKKVAKKVIKKTVEDPNYDPFAPMESSSNKVSKKAAKIKPDPVNIISQQLTSQEINRYIAMMQAAVQAHWKVAIAMRENLLDPLVEMQLRRDGSLLSVKILTSSGDTLLDQSLIQAIRAAAPFTIPRQQFESFRHNRIRFHPLK